MEIANTYYSKDEYVETVSIEKTQTPCWLKSPLMTSLL